MLKKISPVIVVGIGLTALCMYLFISGPVFVRDISNKYYDVQIRRTQKPAKTDRVAILDLDEASLAKHGQWPWPRYLVAEMTQKALDAGVSVIAFDIVFAEKDRTSPAAIKAGIRERFDLNVDFQGLPPELEDYDRLFADALKKGKTILGCYMRPIDNPVTNLDLQVDPYYQSSAILYGKAPESCLYENIEAADAMTIAIPEISGSGQTAFFNARPDPDNIVRSNPLVWGMGTNRVYLGLSLKALHMDMGGNCVIRYDEQGVLSIRVGDRVIPTDNYGHLMINFREVEEDKESGSFHTFPTYSVAKLLEGKVGQAELTNKIVFVGTSAAGLQDIRATPLTQFFPGVEVHATIVDNVLSGDMLYKPTAMILGELAAIILMGIFLSIFISRGKSWLSFVVSVVIIVAADRLSLALLERYHVVFVPAWVILSVIIIYPVLTTIKFWQEELQKKRVRHMFGTMVSKDVLHYLENNPGSFSLSGQRAEATMFFSDVAGFTTISEKLEPGELSDLLNRYLSPMTDIIMARRGYVDKYEGDAIMAEWGVPFAMPDHATQACLSALEQQEKLAELRPALREEFGHEINVRMGLNSGTVTAGNMGSDKRFSYTVMGDAVNQAARFEPANKTYDTLIMMGETTYLEAKDSIEARLLDKIVVKGKTKPISIYELLARKGQLPEKKARVAALYEQALRIHWERKWDEAIGCLNDALALDPKDGPSAKMRDRIIMYKENPPSENWAGEYVRTTKD